MTDQVRKAVTIVNKLGLHARAAAKLVGVAGKFQSQLRLKKDGREVNAKSIMGVMMLAAGQGKSVEILADGDDAQEAVQALEKLVQERFGEAE